MDKHYLDVKREMAKEKLLTVEEILQRTQVSPRTLWRSLQAIVRGMRLYPQEASSSHSSVRTYAAELTTTQDPLSHSLSGLAFSERNDKHKKPKDRESGSDEELMTFEELVMLSGEHPLLVERSLEKIAKQHRRLWDF